MPDAKPQKDSSESLIFPKRYTDDTRWLLENYTELVQKYPDMWIAIMDKEVVIASKDLGEVYRVGRQKEDEVGRGPCIYDFVESPLRFRGPIDVQNSD